RRNCFGFVVACRSCLAATPARRCGRIGHRYRSDSRGHPFVLPETRRGPTPRRIGYSATNQYHTTDPVGRRCSPNRPTLLAVIDDGRGLSNFVCDVARRRFLVDSKPVLRWIRNRSRGDLPRCAPGARSGGTVLTRRIDRNPTIAVARLQPPAR